MSDAIRKIIHIDMDAFYASVELKRHPHLIDQPVVISSHHPRAVIAAASYKAREFGLRSAMPMSQARKRCPQLVVIPPDFAEYRRVSQQIHQIFQTYTPFIEPLSLDEAYLDVTQNLQGLASATEVAIKIRADIEAVTGLTASAGVAPNKFLAKVASDWNKPNGLCVIKPHQVNAFIQDLSLDKIPGVGRVTLAKLNQMNLNRLGDVQAIPVEVLVQQLGKYGHLLHQFAHGIDHRAVEHQRERQQISKEITFDVDRRLSECGLAWSQLLDQIWHNLEAKQLQAKTIHIKLRHPDFQTIAHQRTYRQAFQDHASLHLAMQQLLNELQIQSHEKFRLIGVGVSHLEQRQEQAQMELW